MSDHPFNDVVKTASKKAQEGYTIHQKWTCAACGERITMNEPGKFYTEGLHENCPVDPKRVTDIKAQGCNYLAIFGMGVKQ